MGRTPGPHLELGPLRSTQAPDEEPGGLRLATEEQANALIVAGTEQQVKDVQRLTDILAHRQPEPTSGDGQP